ncbi:MAG: hypothetical protein ABI688_00620 [Bacteroidota bacterium]
MDTGTAIIALIIILIGVLPFVLMNRKRKRTEKKLLDELTGLAMQNNCRVSQHQVFSNSVVGLDDTTGRIFFLKATAGGYTKQQVKLSEIERCRVEKTGILVNGGNAVEFDKLDLLFTYRDKKNPEASFCIYNGSTDGTTLTDEIMVAGKWAKMLTAKIGNKKSIAAKQTA